MRKRKIVIGIAIGLVCALLLAAGLYFIPVKVTPIDMSFEAVKSDNDGNEYGTVPVTVKGKICEYLFRNSRITLEISKIEDLYDITLWGADKYNSVQINQPDEHGFYMFDCNASSTVVGENSYIVTIFFKEDFSRWEFFRLRAGASADPGYRDLDFTYRYKAE